MTTTATTLLNPSTPALPRIRALLALLASLILQPKAGHRIAQLFAEVETLIASHALAHAIQRANSPYRTADMYEARFIWRGGFPDVDIRLRPGALHPLHRIIAAHRRARRIALVRRALGRRSRFSNKLRTIQTRTNARRSRATAARHGAHTQFTFHTPSRIAAPP